MGCSECQYPSCCLPSECDAWLVACLLATAMSTLLVLYVEKDTGRCLICPLDTRIASRVDLGTAGMDREKLLELLFRDEPSLLQMDTGLRAREPEEPVSEDQDDTVAVDQEDTIAVNAKDTVAIGQDENRDIEREETPPTDNPNPPQTPSVNPSGSFCPAIALSRFPYKFIRDHLCQLVASEFFNEGKFWDRTWDLSVYSPLSPHICLTG